MPSTHAPVVTLAGAISSSITAAMPFNICFTSVVARYGKLVMAETDVVTFASRVLPTIVYGLAMT